MAYCRVFTKYHPSTEYYVFQPQIKLVVRFVSPSILINILTISPICAICSARAPGIIYTVGEVEVGVGKELEPPPPPPPPQTYAIQESASSLDLGVTRRLRMRRRRSEIKSPLKPPI